MPPELEEQQSPMEQVLQLVAGEVLETMFFTEAEASPCEHEWLETARCALIRFEGSHLGEMLLGVSGEAVEPIAAGFLGLDPMELTDAQRGQVVQELANIMCGALMSHLWPESDLALSSPALEAWREWADESALHGCFTLPEGKLALSIRLIPRPRPPANE